MKPAETLDNEATDGEDDGLPAETPMQDDSRLMSMLTGYAASHRHPFNVAIHLVGIPSIMFGALVALSWAGVGSGPLQLNLAWLLVLGFFFFYLTLDRVFALVFLLVAALMTVAATRVGELPLATSGTIAAATFGGGYLAQFIGHAVEKSPPVLLRHPVQAQLAAPFFTIVEVFKLLGLREALFDEVQARLSALDAQRDEGTPQSV